MEYKDVGLYRCLALKFLYSEVKLTIKKDASILNTLKSYEK